MIRLEDIKKSKRFEDALKMSWRRFTRRLEDVLKTPWRLLGKTPWRCLEDVFKTSWRCLEDVFARCLKDVLKAVLQDAFWRRMTKANMFVLIKTCSEDEDKRRLVFVLLGLSFILSFRLSKTLSFLFCLD